MISFNVEGVPSPGGSKRGLHHRWTGRIVLIDCGGARTKAWRSRVAAAGQEAMLGRELYIGPLRLIITFRMPRPKSHFNRRGKLLDWAPAYPATKPDLTKLLRSTEDALTGIIWNDDCQIVETMVNKVYAAPKMSGATISVCDEKTTENFKGKLSDK